MKNLSIFFALTSLIFPSCDSFQEVEPEPEPIVYGCTDRDALNYSYTAEQNDGSCEYSQVVFYARYSIFNGWSVTGITLEVDGSNIGNITSFYANGVGNCSAQGTVPFQFNSSYTADWNATITLANGQTIFTNGTVSPSSYQECIKVNVTR